MVLLPLDLIYTNSGDPVEVAMCKTPFDDVLDGIEYLFPRRLKAFSDLFPRQRSCPACQKLHVWFCKLVLALGPRDFLNSDSTCVTVHSPHHVEEKYGKAPKRDELKSARLLCSVVTWRGIVAARTDRCRSFARIHGHLNTFSVAALSKPSFFIHKALELLASIQDGLQ